LFFVNENLMLFNFPSVCAGTVPYGRRPLFTGEKAKTGFFLYLYCRFAKGFLDLVFFNFGRYFSPLNRVFAPFFCPKPLPPPKLFLQTYLPHGFMAIFRVLRF